MSLPILMATPSLDAAALARHYVQSEIALSAALCDAALEMPSVIVCPALPDFRRANRVLDLHITESADIDSMLRSVESAAADARGELLQWQINPTTPPAVRQRIEGLLTVKGYRRQSVELLLLRKPAAIAAAQDLQVVPARSSYELTRRLFADAALPNARVVARAMLHWLDEPRLDSLLALDGREPIGFVSVHTLGQVGRVLNLFVAATHRRRGIGQELVRRALEIGVRSSFRHVFASADENDTRRRLEAIGFVPSTAVEVFSRGL